MKKKLLFLLFIVCFSCLLLGFVACNSEDSSEVRYSYGLEYTISEDGTYYEVTSIGTCTDTDIVIPSTYNSLPVTAIAENAFQSCNTMMEITIGASIDTIGAYAFSGCSSLCGVYITDVAAWCNISFGNYLANPLYYAGNLYLNGNLVNNLVIPEGVTSISDFAFCSCKSVASVTFSSSVNEIGKCAFADTSISQLDIPNSVTSIENEAFERCLSLTSVSLPDSITTINQGVFQYCTALQSIDIPEGVTLIEFNAFDSCTGLKKVTIPSSITTIKMDAFYGCTSLAGVYITDMAAWCNISFGLDSGNPLYYAGKLYLNNKTVTSLEIPESVTSISSYAFCGCTSIKELNITENVASIGSSAFSGCTSITWIKIDNGVTSIGNWAFYNCKGLVSVTIPASVIEIGVYAFYNCTSITDIIFEDTTMWYYGYNGKTTDGTQIDLSDSSTAAKEFVKNKYSHSWYKE